MRYTLGDRWLLIKGENIKVKPSKEQYRELATHLVYGELKADFINESHCRGCVVMKRAAPGCPETVIRVQIWGPTHPLAQALVFELDKHSFLTRTRAELPGPVIA